MGADMGAMGGTKVLLLVFLVGWEKSLGLNWNPVPRKTVRYQGPLITPNKPLGAKLACSVGGETFKSLSRRVGQHGEVQHSGRVQLQHADSVRPREGLYVGAREALFALDPNDISIQLRPQIDWPAPQDKKRECVAKGKNNQTECFNYIRFLQSYNHTHLYTCGTYAFQPKCTYVHCLAAQPILAPVWLSCIALVWSTCAFSSPLISMNAAVTVTNDSVATDVHASHVTGDSVCIQQRIDVISAFSLLVECRDGRGDVDVSAVCQYQISDVKKVFEGAFKEYRGFPKMGTLHWCFAHPTAWIG
ncbi:Semaphorin-4C, partial [Nibea albiflora]